jgi:hypothetical protein
MGVAPTVALACGLPASLDGRGRGWLADTKRKRQSQRAALPEGRPDEAVEEQLSAPLGGVILDPDSFASPQERIREALRRHLESYRKESKIIGVIEQMARHDKQVNALRMERHQRYSQQVATSIRNLQQHGLADPRLDPRVAAAALGAMTSRFPEMWLVQGAINCSFDKAVDQLTRVFVNALGLPEEAANARHRPQAS